MRNLWMMAVLSACAVEEGADEQLDLETTIQELASFWSFSHSSERDLVGFNTSLNSSTHTCVLSGIFGDLGEGGYYDVADVASYGGARPDSHGTWRVYAHGGAYTNQTNDRVWADNPVRAKASCVALPSSASASWESSTLPKKIAGMATGRRCFLSSIAGGGQIFTHADDYVRVRLVGIFSTDATHPTAGWYVEGNLEDNPVTGQPAYASAYCIDFPEIEDEWIGTVNGDAATITAGTGVKMCGLTMVKGAFNVESTINGVQVIAPSSQSGNWTLSASPGKSTSVRCVQ